MVRNESKDELSTLYERYIGYMYIAGIYTLCTSLLSLDHEYFKELEIAINYLVRESSYGDEQLDWYIAKAVMIFQTAAEHCKTNQTIYSEWSKKYVKVLLDRGYVTQTFHHLIMKELFEKAVTKVLSHWKPFFQQRADFYRNQTSNLQKYITNYPKETHNKNGRSLSGWIQSIFAKTDSNERACLLQDVEL